MVILNFVLKPLMKSLLTSVLLSSTLLLNSCTTTVLASKDNDELARKLQNGKTYTFIKDDGSRSKFTVQRIDATTVAGTNFEGKVIEIPRNQIAEIKKTIRVAPYLSPQVF